MKKHSKLLKAILFGALALGAIFNVTQSVSAQGAGTIPQLNAFVATSSPIFAITQRIFGTPLVLTGYPAGCAQFSSTSTLTSTGVNCGAGGSTSTPSVGSFGWLQFASSSSNYFDATSTLSYSTTTRTFTLGGGNSRLETHAIKGDASDGLLIESNNGTDIGILGAGNTANITWYGNHNFEAQTANTIASFGASKTLTSLSTSTYPSLTELSYGKGVTSAIQTQLNGKQASGTYVTGATNGTLTLTSTTLGLNLGNANTWTGQQTFNTSAPKFGTLTAGSIPYIGASGVISENNAALAWDNTNSRLSFGNVNNYITRDASTGSSKIVSPNTTFIVESFTGNPILSVTAGAITGKSIVTGDLFAYPYPGSYPTIPAYFNALTGQSYRPGSSVAALADTVIAPNDIYNGSPITIDNAATLYIAGEPYQHPSGATVSGNKWSLWIGRGAIRQDYDLSNYASTTINSIGGVTYDAAGSGASFTFADKIIASSTVRLKGYTVSTLPTGVQGDTAYVTDALAPTFLGALVGGGAIVTPVFYNGSAWVAH